MCIRDSINIFHRTLAPGDFVQDLVHSLCSHTARGTFTTGLIYRELQEEFGNIYHTGIFIHNDHTAGSHHGADGDQDVYKRQPQYGFSI